MLNFTQLKLEIFIPESHLPPLREALQSVGAGCLGNYDSCLSYSKVTGAWRPLKGSHPYLGEEGEISEAEEIKVEVNINAENLNKTLNAIYEVHPYEEPLVNVIPIFNRRQSQK
ncbi:MAG: cytochrome C biogenesis protein [Selenomonadaceae bacterium]|nr:cytochrome C biogenesis protein [Selenomonadaceae bacterium]